MSPKLITTQCLLHIAEKKYACTHMLRSGRALRRCTSHSAHACTSLEARVHAHRADRTQKSDNSNLFKHKKYGKHAQTERSRRHGQGMGHAGTKGWGRKHWMCVIFGSQASNNFAHICVTVHTGRGASASPNLQRCPCARHPLCVLPCLCPPILGRLISHRVCSDP